MNVVFDLDGTLIDSMPQIHRAVSQALGQHGLPALALAQVRGFVGNGAPTLVARCLTALGQPADGALFHAVHAALLDNYETDLSGASPYPGVPEALDALRADGHALGICTNKPLRPTLAILDHLLLRETFATIIAGDSLPVHKPDPAPLHEAIRHLGGGPAVFVGDSEVDGQTAGAAGVPFLLFTEGYRKSPVESLPGTPFGDFALLPALVAAHGSTRP